MKTPRRDPNRVHDLVRRYQTLSARFPQFAVTEIGAVERFGLRFPLLAVAAGAGPRSAIILAGTHGDEVAGPLALLQFWEDAANHAHLEGVRFLCLPLINPVGFARGIRGNGVVDLNRHFDRPTAQPENEIALDFLRQQRAELLVSLHEDVTSPCFYMYESGVRERALFARIVADDVALLDALAAAGHPVCATDHVDGNYNRGGLVVSNPGSVRAGRSGALEPTLLRHGVIRRVVGFETPGRLPLPDRIAQQQTALRHVLRSFLV